MVGALIAVIAVTGWTGHGLVSGRLLGVQDGLRPTPSVTFVTRSPTPRAKKAPPSPSPSPTAAPLAQSPTLPPVRATATYQVAFKGDVTAAGATFAADAARILADPQGWRGIGIEFKQVDSGGQFTLWLADDASLPTFSDGCTRTYSCRSGPNVVINADRWTGGAPAGVMDDVPLENYRTMVINHEVGHWLGHDHLECPAPGAPAPLMQQQSKGLDGCTFNAYPLDNEKTAPNLGL
jgi:hypothetical protein